MTTLRPSKTTEERAENPGYYGNKPVKAKDGLGGLHTTGAKMQAPAKIPCRECPLRRDSAPGYLGGYTPEMYVEMMHSPASVACHCSKGFHEGDIGAQRHCTGIAGYRANAGVIPTAHGYPTAAYEAVKLVGNSYPRDPMSDFFASPEEFIAHHAPGQVGAGIEKTAHAGPAYPEDWGHDGDDPITGE